MYGNIKAQTNQRQESMHQWSAARGRTQEAGEAEAAARVNAKVSEGITETTE